jgi:hypothetical protein
MHSFRRENNMKTDEGDLQLHGSVAEHDSYVYHPKNEEETHYLTAILNSYFAFSILKKIKSATHI